MVNILSAILFCIFFNLDNIAIGIAYGMKKIKVGIGSNLLITFITTSSTFITMYIGKIITEFISLNLVSILGSSIIIFLGLYFLLQNIINLYKNNNNIKILLLKSSDDMMDYASKTDKDNSNYIDIKEAIAVGLSLSFNNIGIGIIASTTNINLFLVTIFTFIFSFIFISFGIYLGNNFIGKILGRFAPMLSGILLIILGIVEMFY